MNNIITYHAESLEDIAKLFDQHAVTATNRQLTAKTVKEGAGGREAYAWLAAAQILRQTKLKS